MNDGCKIQAERRPQIEEQKQRLDKSILDLGELCEKLEIRLATVLTPIEQREAIIEKEPIGLVAQAQDLLGFTNRVDRIHISIASMLSRIEL